MGFAIPVSLALAFAACQGSNSMSGPPANIASPAVNIAGLWSGSFQPDSASCTSSSATAVFQQDGANVTGNLTTSACGVAGLIKGTIHGETLIGSISLPGCKGGAVTGTIGAGEITLSVGDITKPLIAGEQPWMFGGAVNIRR